MKSAIVVTWLALITLATSWFFFSPGMFYLHDYLHAARVAEVLRGLEAGHFPVRWSENFGFGYGMPLFQFYAPLPFYVGSLFALIGVPVIAVTKLLFILCNIFTTWGSYLMGRTWFGRVGGLITAAAVSLAPYRAVNLYVRGALSELWGVMAIVWSIYFLFLTLRGEKHAWIGMTTSLIVLFLSHNLLTMIFIPFSLAILVVTALYHYWQDKKKIKELVSRTVTALASYLLAAACAAFYLFPAFLEKGYTQVQSSIVGGYFDYALHFVYLRQFFQPTWGYGGSNWGAEDGISFFLGYGQLLALFLSLATLLITIRQALDKRSRKLSRALWWWCCGIGAVFVCSLLLATEKFSFVWHSVELLQFLQFPWRFLSLSLVFAGLVAPIFLYAQRSFVKRWVLGWLVLLTFFANTAFFRPQSFIDQPSQYYSGDKEVISSTLSAVLPDYLPEAASQHAQPALFTAECLDSCNTLEVVEDAVHTKTVMLQTDNPTQVRFSINNFPGWTAYINNQVVDIIPDDGLITTLVPAGKSTVAVVFESTPVRHVSDWVSAGSFIVFGALIWLSKVKHV